MEMNVAPLIHNSALWGTNAGKTSRIGRGGEEGLFLRVKESAGQPAEAGLFWNMELCGGRWDI